MPESPLVTRSHDMDVILRLGLLSHRLPTIQVDDVAAQLLTMVTAISRPRRILEIGTLFGYSTLHLAAGMPPDCELLTLESDSMAAAVARESFAIHPSGARIQLMEADAVNFLSNYEGEPFDFIFIDGLKRDYPTYLKLIFPLLATRGIILADDVGEGVDFSDEPGGHAAARQGLQMYLSAVRRSPLLRSFYIPCKNGMYLSMKA